MTGYTRRLAGFAATQQPDAATAHAALRTIVDWAGCALGGSTHGATAVAAGSLGLLGTGADCTLVGLSERASPYAAAFVNGVSSHVLDFDDVNVVMIGHPGVVVVPAALAAAELAGAPPAALLAAVTAGYQVAAALGALVNPEHYERGWHATGTLGCAAAAAAAGRVFGLESGAMARAISIGLTQAGALRTMFGSHGKAFHAGRAAAAGLLAADLARRGMEVPEDGLEGPAGYLGVATGDPQVAAWEAIWAAPPAIQRTAVKGHAACGGTHCLIDAVAGLVREHDLEPAQLERIDARVHPLAVRAAGIESPRTGLEAKFSLRHTAAMAAFRYPLLPAAFEDATFTSPAIEKLREAVHIEVDESFPYEQAMPADVTVTTTGGDRFHAFVEAPRGRPANPMTDAELDAKFLGLAEPVLGERARPALAQLRGLGRGTAPAAAAASLAR